MRMARTTLFMMMLAALALPSTAIAQKPVTQADAVSASFTIVAIDSGARVVTIKDKDGLTQDIACGPEVQRFDQLKVGDVVTFRYYESVATNINKAGAPAKAPVSAAVSRTPGEKPGGTIARELTATVTIAAIDPTIPSVTVTTDDGNKMSFKAENKDNLEGYKAGDKVDITYTQALAISVTPPK